MNVDPRIGGLTGRSDFAGAPACGATKKSPLLGDNFEGKAAGQGVAAGPPIDPSFDTALVPGCEGLKGDLGNGMPATGRRKDPQTEVDDRESGLFKNSADQLGQALFELQVNFFGVPRG